MAGFWLLRHFREQYAFTGDTAFLVERSWPLLEGLRVLVLDALRIRPHPAHFCLAEALEVIDRLQPQQAWLTHISHDMDHATISRQLPHNVALAYDGLHFEF